jgi:hypothetical protein
MDEELEQRTTKRLLDMRKRLKPRRRNDIEEQEQQDFRERKKLAPTLVSKKPETRLQKIATDLKQAASHVNLKEQEKQIYANVLLTNANSYMDEQLLRSNINISSKSNNNAGEDFDVQKEESLEQSYSVVERNKRRILQG